MPLFRALPFGRTKDGQLQEVSCPRCKVVLESEATSKYGEGASVRIVEGEYKCFCGYSVVVTEKFPVVNRALDEEKHI